MAPEPVAPRLRVDVAGADLTFDRAFVVGRDPASDVAFEGHARVSRAHVRVYPVEGRWWVEDLDSANGLLIDGVRVRAAEVTGDVHVQLGEGGPSLTLHAPHVDAPPLMPEPSDGDAARYVPAAVIPEGPGRLGDPPSGPRATPTYPAPHEASRPSGPVAVAPPPDPPPGTGLGETAAATPDTAPDAAPTQAPVATGDGGAGETISYEKVVERYFAEDEDDADVGERTRFIRQAYKDIQQATTQEHTSRERRYRVAIVAAIVVGIAAVGYAVYREMAIRELRAEAAALFLELRSYDVAVAQQVVEIERQIEASPESEDSLRGRLDEALETRRRTAARYDQFVRGLGVYDGLSSEEEAIYRVARAFGESELMIPPEFVDEVKVYIQRWRNSNRFQTAVRTAQVNGYIPMTVDALRRNGLPLEFFYLSMQESNFDTRAVGPPTRYGYAKGAWQFIPETGRRYGLEPGPLVNERVFDPLDERQQFDLAVNAAAKYLHDIYVHLSQASGLLVCASYNWGEHRVREKMRGIANDPAHRTYWRFLTEYRNRMPDETKGYVMNIFAAAVIGQNPRMFGIDMDPPLSDASIARSGGAPVTDRASGARTRLGTGALESRRSTRPPAGRPRPAP